MSQVNEQTLREVHASTAIRFGTTAPYELGPVEVRRIGFGDIPVVLVQVFCRSQDLGAITPVVRQHVYHELETAGISNRAVAFVPTVQRGRRRRFVDRNESSPTLGKNRMGEEQEYHFEIQKDSLVFFEWTDYRYGQIPEAKKVPV